jgi:uncharacterized protein
MESTDRELIMKVGSSNDELRSLYEEHIELNGMIDRLECMAYQTPQEQVEVKRLKSIKLRGLRRMMDLVEPYRLQN